jgi:cell wall-associated NlpC family hydrolase
VANCNLHRPRNRHHNAAMRIPAKVAIMAFCALHLCGAWGQSANSHNSQHKRQVQGRNVQHTLTRDDGLSVIAAALDLRKLRPSGDCSHLVQAIYERAGFRYTFANSYDLYDGVEGFQRVFEPQPGDLIVWRGHVGIVVHPSRHIFFSFKSSGPGTADYTTGYWMARGRPRFYRYVKNDPCPGCVLRAGRGE